MNTVSYSNTGTANATDTKEQNLGRRKVGRPRKSPESGTCAIAVTITKQQRKWLEEITENNVDLSMSKIVREALELWRQVRMDGMVLQPRQEPDDYDYGWR